MPSATTPNSPAVELTRDSDELKSRFLTLETCQDVAELLEVEYMHLVHILYRAPYRYRYRTFEIPKKSGGVRTISEPPESLKILQSKLNTILQLVYLPRPSTHGFVSNRSILTNAIRHTGKRFVLNVDLESFFPSINFGRVRGLFMAPPYELSAAAATVVAQICCHDNQLPQGAPTSPVVSNMICSRLDGEFQQLAKEQRCIYTRYADDITFSTTRREFPRQLAEFTPGPAASRLSLGDDLKSVIERNGFRINEKKSRLQLPHWRQEVTGLTVNRYPNVRRRYVRQLRAMLHAVQKHGMDSAEREFRERYDRRSRRPDAPPPSFAWVLLGKLNFLKMVKGEDDLVYRRLRNKLNSLVPDLIDALPEIPSATVNAIPSGPNWKYYFDLYKDLVFQLEVRKENGDKVGGTAFACGPTTLATAAHNLEGEVHVSPPLPVGQPVTDWVIHDRYSEGVDVALVWLSGVTIRDGGRIPMRDQPLAPGERVAALGYPSIPFKQSALGIYTGRVESEATDYGGTVHTVQVDIEIAGGMSGGPVIDGGGNLVGIVTETTFAKQVEETAEDVPGRVFRHILPVSYLREISPK